MAKVNFTKEHESRLYQLAVAALFNGMVIQLPFGNATNIFDMVNFSTINTLSTVNSNLKKEIEKISGLDEWSMTDYQQQKLENTKEMQELVNLLIGYRKYKDQKESAKKQLAVLKAKHKEIKESDMSTSDKLKAIEEEMAALEGDSEERTETAPQEEAAPIT